MATDEKHILQSEIYRRLFELAKKEGIEVVSSFVSEYRELVNSQDFLTKAILNGKHDTLAFTKRHKAMTEFVRSLNTDKKCAFMTDYEFLKLMDRINSSDLDLFIEGSGLLEELEVEKVSLMSKTCGIISGYKTTVWYDDSNEVTQIDKQYSNGLINYRGINPMGSYNYDIYRAAVSFLGVPGSKYVLSMENRAKGKHAYISVSDFAFTPEDLPSKDEIWSLEVPKTLIKSKEFYKR